ncbi:MAG: alpha-amylase family glycosyl hydrolase, partial [Chitinispirillia bacterium]
IDLPIGIKILKGITLIAKGVDRNRLKRYIQFFESQKNYNKLFEKLNNKQFHQLMRKYPDVKNALIYEKELKITVEREKALFSAWYEMFPRSCGEGEKHGTFNDCINLLPDIAKMGFDVLYFPPIHPIGKANRKGRNNSLPAKDDDPGSPWAIGSELGGHKSIEPKLGTINDFKKLLKEAAKLNMEIALDIAFQCSPDHPYIKSHPQWFRFLPDGSIQYAENPPKKYEDIVSFDFDSSHRKELWEELKAVFQFWIDIGVKIFRVDNPHTKPFMFWDWVIEELKKYNPDVIFLSEAFTRPYRMYRLAKGGFSQSYTYFIWRNSKQEFIDYINELTTTEISEFFRPNFWPNTPDILPIHLQYGGRPAFISRLILAATLSSNYGIYGPAFELCVSESLPDKEEYYNSEKYEIKNWNRNKEGNLTDLIALVNKIRKQNPALHRTKNVKFCHIDNDCLLSYYKTTDDLSNIIIVIVNIDPYHSHIGNIHVPINEFGIDNDQTYIVHDLLSGDRYPWKGTVNYIELNPARSPAHIFFIERE